MSTRHHSKQTPPLFPFLFGIYPILGLLAANISQVHLINAVRGVGYSLAFVIVIYALIRLLRHEELKTALLTTWITFCFFAYGHLYGVLEGKTLFGLVLGRHLTLLPLWGLLFLAGLILLQRRSSYPPTLIGPVNLFTTALIVMPLTLIAMNQIQVYRFNQRSFQSQNDAIRSGKTRVQSAVGISAGELPDVYYFVLDGYTRADTLKQYYQFDNSTFINDLKNLGFYIGDCSMSNYAYTPFSLSSTLQMAYVQNLDNLTNLGMVHVNYARYEDYILHNPVRQNLSNLGYKMVAFETGYPFTEVMDADIYVQRVDNPMEKMKSENELAAFEELFIRTTLMRPAYEVYLQHSGQFSQTILTPDEVRYDRIRFVLDRMDEINLISGPKFVFTHITSPHAPFVLTPDGQFSDVRSTLPGYTNAIQYLNKRVLVIIKNILANSKRPPMIILQGDHGWLMDHRMQILNAYFVPSEVRQYLYPSITPVNSFRIIFSRFFGMEYKPLEDISYFSPEDAQYQLKVIKPDCQK